MFNFISENKTFSSRQFGLRWKRSCAYAVAEITEKIRLSVNNKKPMYINDITKAFDTIDHSIFVRRLDNFSFRVYFNRVFQSYFNNRQQYVCFQCKTTEIKNIGDSIQRGSLLGPLHFLNICQQNFGIVVTLFTTVPKFFVTENRLNQNIKNSITEAISWLNKTNFAFF